MNSDLRDGITDGVVKKINPNRGGFPNDDDCMRDVSYELHSDLYDPSFQTGRAYADRLTTLHG